MAKVFPASAGMIPGQPRPDAIAAGVPRIRGDDPPGVVAGGRDNLCSPHPRG